MQSKIILIGRINNRSSGHFCLIICSMWALLHSVDGIIIIIIIRIRKKWKLVLATYVSYDETGGVFPWRRHRPLAGVWTLLLYRGGPDVRVSSSSRGILLHKSANHTHSHIKMNNICTWGLRLFRLIDKIVFDVGMFIHIVIFHSPRIVHLFQCSFFLGNPIESLWLVYWPFHVCLIDKIVFDLGMFIHLAIFHSPNFLFFFNWCIFFLVNPIGESFASLWTF